MTDDPRPDRVGIREVSELTGLSIDTLRWYERQGLLPLVERGTGGRRRYPPAAVRFIRLVQALRRTGMPVSAVREFVRMGSGVEWHDRRAALLDFCARHGITAETEVLPAHEVNSGLDRLARNDVRYRFVLDMGG